MKPIRYRQIHLDFHTSPHIPGIGSRFDADEFGDTLLAAGVDSINLFAKCHHGMFYYPTAIGTMHPGLAFDLFGAQVDTCRKRGIRTIAYTCAGWNEDWADRHPEWLQVSPEGVVGLKRPFDSHYYGWRTLCIGRPEYRAQLKAELSEIAERYGPRGVEGFWIDIVLSRRCVCDHCRKDMANRGLDPSRPEDLARHDRENEIGFMEELTAHIRSLDPGLIVYYNGHPYDPDLRDDPVHTTERKRKAMDFVDIESLPSDAWGYTHFPVNVNYLNKYSQSLTMMNGKFHLAWGDFGSLRNEEALEYECFRGLAHGAKVCVGDQLHPTGRLEPAAYDRVGRVLRTVAELEPYCVDTGKVREVGVFLAHRVLGSQFSTAVNQVHEGVYRLLTELRIPFDFIDFEDDLAPYRLVIVPEGLTLPETVLDRIDRFIASGGRLLGIADGGRSESGDRLPAAYCAEPTGQAPFCPRYFRVPADFDPDIPAMDTVVYGQCTTARARAGGVALLEVVDPYFQRSHDRFCSHRQTPPNEATGEPAVLLNERTAYISVPLFSDYVHHGLKFYKLLLRHVIRRLLPDPLVEGELPSTAEVTLRRQGRDLLVHVLNYVIQGKASLLDTIEDRFPLRDVALSVRCPQAPARAELVPQHEAIPCQYADGRVRVTIPLVDGHQVVRIESAFPADA